ncbi:redox-regulated ATPase YchF [Candidatus Peregrinibacteria bacterium]|nr:redox-regulated ATPase YchF [Candidatus Peregrinibacteria bacterium]
MELSENQVLIRYVIKRLSSGKSTFLNAACLTDVKVSELPFTTIDANKGVAYAKIKCVCKEFKVNDNPKNSICINGNRFVPLNLLDVAGLVPDAHKGKGLGNKFLNDLSRADVLLHIVDSTGSLDKSGNRIAPGSNDPYEDILFLEEELDYWIKDIMEREDWGKLVRTSGDKKKILEELHNRLSGLKITRQNIATALKNSNLEDKSPSEWTEEDKLYFSKVIRGISKPILVIANKIDKEISKNNIKIVEKKYKGPIIPCSALAEYYLRRLSEKKIIEYIPGDSDFKILKKEKLNQKEQNTLLKIREEILDIYKGIGVQESLNYAVFNIANLIAVYPVSDVTNLSDKDNNILPDVFLVEKGTKLIDFTREKIHSDLAEHFIHGIDARTNRRLGRDYELQHNDIIKIVTAK